MQPIEFQVCPTNQDYPVCYVLDDGYCYQLLNNKMNYLDQTFEVQRVRSASKRPIRITKERIVRTLELSQIKIIATLAWIPIDPTKYYHGIPAKDLSYIKQKIEQLFSKNAEPGQFDDIEVGQFVQEVDTKLYRKVISVSDSSFDIEYPVQKCETLYISKCNGKSLPPWNNGQMGLPTIYVKRVKQ